MAGEAEEDGYEDEYQLEDIDIGASNYIKAVPLHNFRSVWEETNPDSELADDYGLGVRDSLQVMSIADAHCTGSTDVGPAVRYVCRRCRCACIVEARPPPY